MGATRGQAPELFCAAARPVPSAAPAATTPPPPPPDPGSMLSGRADELGALAARSRQLERRLASGAAGLQQLEDEVRHRGLGGVAPAALLSYWHRRPPGPYHRAPRPAAPPRRPAQNKALQLQVAELERAVAATRHALPDVDGVDAEVAAIKVGRREGVGWVWGRLGPDRRGRPGARPSRQSPRAPAPALR
jgi:hypothetical protein